MPVCATNWMFAAVPQAPEAGQALLVCVVQIALASGALLGGEVVDWQGVSSAMLFGGALILRRVGVRPQLALRRDWR